MTLSKRQVLILGLVEVQGALAAELNGATIHRINHPVPFTPQQIDDELGLPGDLDIPTASQDMVIAGGWCEHTPWTRWSLQEVQRVLKPEGTFKIAVPTCDENLRAHAGHAVASWKTRLKNVLGQVCPGQSYGNAAAVFDELGLRIEQQDQQLCTGGRVQIGDLTITTPRIGQTEVFLAEGRKGEACWPDHPPLSDLKTVTTLINKDYKAELAALKRFKTKYNLCNPPSCKPVKDALRAKHVLVLSPHPDDELIGVGGAMHSLVAQGASVTVLQLTNGRSTVALSGQPETLQRKIRLNEAKQVAKALGTDLICWGDVDDGIPQTALPALSKRLGVLLEALQPDLIFVPFVNDPQPDHRAANQMLVTALDGNHHKAEIASYEVWSFCPYNIALDIFDFSATKFSLLGIYRTALRSVNYARVVQWHAAWHALSMTGMPGQAEVYLRLPSDEYLSLAKRVLQEQELQ